MLYLVFLIIGIIGLTVICTIYSCREDSTFFTVCFASIMACIFFIAISLSNEEQCINCDEDTKQWTCECGQVNTGNYCQNCGEEK